MAISNVNVTNAVTKLADIDASRSTITIQHTDLTDFNVPVWISQDAAMVAGAGFYLSGLGDAIQFEREDGSTGVWYGISPGNTVTVAVATGER